MAATILEPDSFRRMPWKNGGGYSSEIAAERDPHSDTMDIAWRVSIAEIRSSGPFSRFPGSDRLMMHLSGQTIELSHLGVPRPPVRLEPFKPYGFDGEWDTQATIKPNPNDPTSVATFDFNLIVRRDDAFGALGVFSPAQLREGAFIKCLMGSKVADSLRVLLYAHIGEAKVGTMTLPQGHAYLWSGHGSPDIPSVDADEHACIIGALIGFRKTVQAGIATVGSGP